MPDYLTLAYDGNYIGRISTFDYFSYNGEVYGVDRKDGFVFESGINLAAL